MNQNKTANVSNIIWNGKQVLVSHVVDKERSMEHNADKVVDVKKSVDGRCCSILLSAAKQWVNPVETLSCDKHGYNGNINLSV